MAGDTRSRGKHIIPPEPGESLPGTIINSLPGIFYLYDQDGHLVRWNEMHEVALGYSAQDLLGKHFLDFFEGADREVIARGVRRIFTDGKAEAEARIITKSGERIPYYFTGVPFTLAGKPHFLGLGIDITERKRAEEALRESEARLRQTTELFPEVVFQCDASGKVTYANQLGFEKFGYSREDVNAGLHIIEMEAPEDRARVLDEVGRLLAGKPRASADVTAARKDGATFPATVYCSPIVEEGKAVGLMGIVVDTTERARLEKNISARADRIMRFHKCLLNLARADLADAGAQTRQLTEASSRALQVERVSVWFFDEQCTSIVCEDIYKHNEGTHQAGQVLHASAHPRYFAALRQNRIIAAADACTDPMTSEFADLYLRPLGITSMLDAPVWLHGKIVGVVCNEHVGPMREWLPEEQDFAVSIADMVSLTVEAADRKRTEEALRRSEEEFRQMVENVPIGIYRSTPDGRMLMANPTMVQMLGYSCFEDLAKQNLDAESNRHGYARRNYKARIERDGRIVGAESVWTRSDGSLIHVRENARAIFDRDGRALYYEGTIEDITEQKWAEGALREEAEFRRATIERAAEGLCVCHEIREFPFVRFTVWNERMTEITGYTVEEINAKGWYQSVYPDADTQARAIERMGRMRQGDDLVSEEWEITRADGARRVVSISTSVLSINDRDVQVLALMQDVTERKRAETELARYQEHLKELVKARTSELEEANRHLQQEIREREQLEAELIKAREAAESANRAKSAFLANMSHGIRTPMNAILGYAQILERDQAIGKTQRQYMEVINRSGEHLLGLINDILEMSKIEAGRVTLNAERVDFEALLSDMEAMFRARAEEKGLALHFERDQAVPGHIYSDGGKIRDVLINLLGNAVKFTDAGAVTVSVGAAAAGGDQRSLVVEVEDTGCGIAPDELAVAFLPFEQTSSGRFRASGTGLGLPISREYARIMGGDLTVESSPGKGSIFRFTFKAGVVDPLAPGSELPEASRQVIGLVPGRAAPRVLVVDDDEASREALTLHLEMIGFEVRAAVDGARAVAAFEQWKPDVVLMDLWMPEMDGLTATRRLKSLPGGSDTPVLVVTASVLIESERDARAAGAAGFVRKPFKKAEVFSEIARVLGVEYVYAEARTAAGRAAAPDEEAVEGAADLPLELVAEIVEAAENGDGAGLRSLLDNNRDVLGEGTRDMLLGLAADYDYRRIVEILNKVATTGK
jgi:PAS domain S-box-containing protein